jgi:hypothetical protein
MIDLISKIKKENNYLEKYRIKNKDIKVIENLSKDFITKINNKKLKYETIYNEFTIKAKDLEIYYIELNTSATKRKKNKIIDKIEMKKNEIQSLMKDFTEDLYLFKIETSKLIKSKNEEYSKKTNFDNEKKDAEIRMSDNFIFSSTNQFNAIFQSYESKLLHFKTINDYNIERRIVEPEIPSQDSFMSYYDNFEYKLIMNKRQLSNSTLNVIYLEELETYNDMIVLENNLKEVEELFKTFKEIVMSQDDLINSIQNNIEMSMDYIEESNKNLKIGHKFMFNCEIL